MADLLAQLRAAVAEFGGDAKVKEIRTVPMTTALPDDPYLATTPPIIGASHQAVTFVMDAHGIAGGMFTGKAHNIDDVQRRSLKKLYGKRAKEIKETGTYRGAGTQELPDNPNEAIESE